MSLLSLLLHDPADTCSSLTSPIPLHVTQEQQVTPSVSLDPSLRERRAVPKQER